MALCVEVTTSRAAGSLHNAVHAQLVGKGVVCTIYNAFPSNAIHHALQVNLFIAVLKIKFAKAQTLFHSRLAKMSKKKRKNILGRVMEKGKKRIKDQVKKQREAGEVSIDGPRRTAHADRDTRKLFTPLLLLLLETCIVVVPQHLKLPLHTGELSVYMHVSSKACSKCLPAPISPC